MKNILLIITIFVSLSVGFNACQSVNNNDNSNSYKLKIKYYSKGIEKPIHMKVLDSIGSIQLKVLYTKNGKAIDRIRTFKLIDNSYFELKLNSHFENQGVDSIYTLAFTKKDTVYDYKFDAEKYAQSWPSGFDDWQYSIKKLSENTYTLKKNHLKDSTFVEEFVYDEKFKLLSVNFFYGSDTLKFEY